MRMLQILSMFVICIALSSCERSLDDLFAEGNTLMARKDYEGALKVYAKVLSRNKNLQLAYFNRGICFKALNKKDSAIESFDKVLKQQSIGTARFQRTPNPLFNSDEANYTVDYNDALYQKAVAEYEADSLRPALHDFYSLLQDRYLISNCNLWIGTIMTRTTEPGKARKYYEDGLRNAQNATDSADAAKMLSQLDSLLKHKG